MTDINPAELVNYLNSFSGREVGVTHPDNAGFIKIADNGDILIFAEEGLGLVLHKANKSITFVADSVKFLVRDKGVIINRSAVNDRARKFTEPVLVPYEYSADAGLFDGYERYVEDDYDDYPEDAVLDRETNTYISREEYVTRYNEEPQWNGECFA